ncbi:uncharacterized protein [Periplaneta americana]|uniref:uncharacterized protein n=1 Tax=Periplaneta americana TaxID=6978 RepID=UPI0037E863E8
MVDKCELQDFNKLEANQYYKSYGSRSQKGLCCPVEIQLVQRISELQLDEKSLAVFIIIILLDPYNNNSTSNEATTESLQEYFSLLLQRYMIWRYGQPQALLLFAHTLLQLSSVKAAIYHGNTCTYNRSLISLLQRVVPKSWHNSGFNMEQISSALYGNEQPVFLSPSQQESNSQGSIGQIPVNISENNQYFHYHMVGNSEKSNHMFSHYTQINSLNALHSSTNIQASLLTNNDCTSKIASLPTETHFSYHKYGLPYSDTGNSQMHTQRHNISDSLQQTSEDQKNFTFNNTSFFDPQYVMPTDLHQQECDTYLPTFKPSCSPSYDQMLPDSGDLAYSKVIMEQLESAVNSSCKTTPESLSFCTDAKKHYNSELDACHNYGQGTENQYCFQQVANAAVPVCDVVGKRYYDNSSGEQCISVQDKEVEQDQENIGIDSFVKNMSSCSVSESGDLSFVHHDNAHSQEKEFSDCQLLDDMLKESSNQLTTPEDDTSFQKDIQTICPPDWWLQDITVCPGSNSSGYISSSSCQLSPQLPSSLSQSL